MLTGLVRDHGLWIYVLLFAYCSLKSGSLPLFAGYAAQADLLQLLPVVAVTFGGGYLGDEVRFAVARRYGDTWSERWPRIGRAISTASALVARYGWLYVFLYRYPKGMRTIGALPLGLGTISWSKFTLLNASSAALWTSLLVGIGFAFGAQVEKAVSAGWGFASIILLMMMVIGIFYAWWCINRIPVAESTAGYSN